MFSSSLVFHGMEKVAEILEWKVTSCSLERRQRMGDCDRTQLAKCVGNYEDAGVRTAFCCEDVGDSSEVIPIRSDEASAVAGRMFELPLVRPLSASAADFLNTDGVQAKSARNQSDLAREILVDQVLH